MEDREPYITGGSKMSKPEQIREEFGYKGKPKQWQAGFDALLKHMPYYFKKSIQDDPANHVVMMELFRAREELVEANRRMFMYGTAFIHYYEDNNGVCKLCTLKEDEALHEK